MRYSDIPSKLAKIWASAAGADTVHAIPVDSQVGLQDGAASLTTGFPPLNAVPRASGGVPPDIKDFNGILQALSAWIVWLQNGGAIRYDPAYVAANGGYPLGSILQSSVTIGREYVSTADNNATNPDSEQSANWATLGLGIATQEEVVAGLANDVAVTPLGLAGASLANLTADGSSNLPGGLIIKWGGRLQSSGEGPINMAFTTPFPNECLRCIPVAVNTSAGNRKDIACQLVSKNAAGFTAMYQLGGGGTVNQIDGIEYIAVGH